MDEQRQLFDEQMKMYERQTEQARENKEQLVIAAAARLTYEREKQIWQAERIDMVSRHMLNTEAHERAMEDLRKELTINATLPTAANEEKTKETASLSSPLDATPVSAASTTPSATDAEREAWTTERASLLASLEAARTTETELRAETMSLRRAMSLARAASVIASTTNPSSGSDPSIDTQTTNDATATAAAAIAAATAIATSVAEAELVAARARIDDLTTQLNDTKAELAASILARETAATVAAAAAVIAATPPTSTADIEGRHERDLNELQGQLTELRRINDDLKAQLTTQIELVDTVRNAAQHDKEVLDTMTVETKRIADTLTEQSTILTNAEDTIRREVVEYKIAAIGAVINARRQADDFNQLLDAQMVRVQEAEQRAIAASTEAAAAATHITKAGSEVRVATPTAAASTETKVTSESPSSLSSRPATPAGSTTVLTSTTPRASTPPMATEAPPAVTTTPRSTRTATGKASRSEKIASRPVTSVIAPTTTTTISPVRPSSRPSSTPPIVPSIIKLTLTLFDDDDASTNDNATKNPNVTCTDHNHSSLMDQLTAQTALLEGALNDINRHQLSTSDAQRVVDRLTQELSNMNHERDHARHECDEWKDKYDDQLTEFDELKEKFAAIDTTTTTTPSVPTTTEHVAPPTSTESASTQTIADEPVDEPVTSTTTSNSDDKKRSLDLDGELKQLRQQMTDDASLFDEAQAGWSRERQALENARTAVLQQRDDLKQQLDQLQHEMEQVQEQIDKERSDMDERLTVEKQMWQQQHDKLIAERTLMEITAARATWQASLPVNPPSSPARLPTPPTLIDAETMTDAPPRVPTSRQSTRARSSQREHKHVIAPTPVMDRRGGVDEVEEVPDEMEEETAAVTARGNRRVPMSSDSPVSVAITPTLAMMSPSIPLSPDPQLIEANRLLTQRLAAAEAQLLSAATSSSASLAAASAAANAAANANAVEIDAHQRQLVEERGNVGALRNEVDRLKRDMKQHYDNWKRVTSELEQANDNNRQQAERLDELDAELETYRTNTTKREQVHQLALGRSQDELRSVREEQARRYVFCLSRFLLL
jgi:hypothetical protein